MNTINDGRIAITSSIWHLQQKEISRPSCMTAQSLRKHWPNNDVDTISQICISISADSVRLIGLFAGDAGIGVDYI